MMLIPIPAESRAKVVGREMHERCEWSGENQRPARLQQPRKFIKRLRRIGNVLQHFAAENRVELPVRFWNRNDVTHNIDSGCVPASGL